MGQEEAEMVVCKSPAELEKMHQAGLIVWSALNKMREMVRPGLSTKDLDEFAERYTAEHRAHPAFKGSGDITSLSQADGYIEISADQGAVDEGALVDVTLF